MKANASRRSNTAAYIESMLLELRTMSVREGSDFLTYLLEMALIEASDIAAGKSAAPVAAADTGYYDDTDPAKAGVENIVATYMLASR